MTTGNKWERCSVADLIADNVLFVGDGYRAKLEELSSAGLPFARAGNIDGGFNFAGSDRFPERNLDRVGNKVSRAGDVVFTSKGTVGRFALVQESTPRFVYSPQLCFWRSLKPERLNARFLFCWMFSREFYVQYNSVAGQTDMAEYVSLGDQRRMHITLPPPVEQEEIADVLGALDDKIELNQQMNETLEAMARAIFKSWFVDFDPVRAKLECRQPFGMDAETAALFPASFQESALGKIPNGWRAALLPEVVEVNPPRPLEKGAQVPYLDMQNMPTKGHRVAGRIMRPFVSGCRPEEILRLRHTDIDLESRKLFIPSGKTKAARRTLTLTQESMHILASRLSNCSRWVFPSPKLPGKPVARLNGRHDALLFRLNNVKVGEKWVEKAAEAQIQFVLYDLRHTFATRLAQAGVDLATLAAILGHSQLRVVQRYIHVTAEHQRAEMLRYDAILQDAEKAAQKLRASFGPVVQ